MLDPQPNRAWRVKTAIQFERLSERIRAACRGGVHHGEERRPVERLSATKLKRLRIDHSRRIVSHERVTDFIEATPARPAEHLQQLIGPDLALEMPADPVTRAGDDH